VCWINIYPGGCQLIIKQVERDTRKTKLLQWDGEQLNLDDRKKIRDILLMIRQEHDPRLGHALIL
jgi:hypothetical protein